uniref:Polyprotein protein n=1 Tax=Solanum tuberosum TaxID=4113 RepID=M1DB70_SOLTU
MIFGTVEIPDMPAYTDVPLATTGDEVRAEGVSATESEAETGEDQLGVDEEATYEGLTEVEEAMVQLVVQTSLRDITIANPCGASVEDAPSTDAPIDGATV